MIEVIDLHKRFGKLKVLQGVDFKAIPGNITAILGPNGSGKSTLMKSMLGQVIPEKGSILFKEQDVKGQYAYRSEIGYLPQIAKFPENLSVRELIGMIKNIRTNYPDEGHLIELFNLDPFLGKKLGTLSGGTRQKVNLVLTLMFDCPLLILDEPTAGLDPHSLINLKEYVRRERKAGKTILITTHIMPLVEELADEILFLLEGKVYFHGSIQELKKASGQDDLEHAIANLLITT